MKKLFIHQNAGDPVWIAMSSDLFFHVLYQDESISTHKSLRSAMDSATKEYVGKKSSGILGWQPIQ